MDPKKMDRMKIIDRERGREKERERQTDRPTDREEQK